MADLWTCPKCHRQFANVNQWHSCRDLSVDDHLEAKSETAVAIYRAVESALRDCGPFRVHPQLTRIAFIARMSFASLVLARSWVDLSFILPAPLDEKRVVKIVAYGPTSFGHRIRLTEVAEVDPDVRQWLCDASARGRQETLDARAEVEPAPPGVLVKLSVPVRVQIRDEGRRLVAPVPNYVGQVFGAHPQVTARIGTERHPGAISLVESHYILDVGDALGSDGSGAGVDVDLTVEARFD